MYKLLCYFFLSSSLLAQWVQVKNQSFPSSWHACNFIDAIDSNTVYFIVNEGYPRPFYLSGDSGETWDKKFTPETFPLIIAAVDSEMWFCSDLKIYHSSNMGSDWELQLDAADNCMFINYIRMFDKNNGIVVGDAITANKPFPVFKTTDGGKNWISVNDSYLGSFSRDQFFPIDFVNMQTGYFYDSRSGKLIKTTNGGSEWNTVEHPAGRLYMIKFFNQNLGLILSDDGSLSYDSLYRTCDGGLTWKTLPLATRSPISHHDIEFLPADGSKIWFTDYAKLYFSADSGNTWQERLLTSDQLGARNIKFIDNNTGWLLCDNGRLFKTINNGGLSTFVSSEMTRFGYDLQNYPNPFNPSTTIRYSIPERTNVQIKIFDVLGREVVTLLDEVKSAGNYEVRFNGGNFASGVYYYQLNTQDYRIVRKMLLVK